MQNSILMNIDPYQEHRMELQYYIDSDFVMNLHEGQQERLYIRDCECLCGLCQ